MSDDALATSKSPLADSRARAEVLENCASHMPVATPQPISSRPSFIDRGSGERAAQPNRSAPSRYASRSALEVNGTWFIASVSE